MDDSMALDLYIGSLIGLAVGDAVGTTLEFCEPGSFTPVVDMEGGGPWQLQAGQWTDDTSMALCMAQSLIAVGGFNPKDQMDRYVKWYKEGYFSSTGRCFDIGGATQDALGKYMDTGRSFSGSREEWTAGNGSIMRLAPVALYFAGDAAAATEYCGKSSMTTHGVQACVDACRLLGALIVGAVQKIDKEELLSPFFHPIRDYWEKKPLSPHIAAITAGSYKEKQPPTIKGSGYVVDSLEAALWAFYKSSSFKEGLLLAVNLGDDADTTGAVYGQLAGAFYGFENIPAEWKEKISKHDVIRNLAQKLYDQPYSVRLWKKEHEIVVLHDQVVVGAEQSYHLYLHSEEELDYTLVFEILDADGRVIRTRSKKTVYGNIYHMTYWLEQIEKMYPEVKNSIDQLREKAGWE